MSQFDNSLAEFRKYFECYAEHNYSESDTRSKNIDFVLLNILNWSEENIQREGPVDNGYFDYKVSLNNFKFIIEAKKHVIEFNLPIKGRRHKLRSIEKLNPDHIRQIRNYIIDCSLSYGVLTNGRQFIIARFNNSDGND